MSQTVNLVGLDCGTTTTSAVVAQARLTQGALGRVELTQLETVFCSGMVFTPNCDDRIDVDKLACYLDEWLAVGLPQSRAVFGGGALVTGLAAQQQNVTAVTVLVESRLSDSVVATANDPILESWLAFMGNCLELSRANPNVPILNLDIGGGTTNLAWGIDGQVVGTGCLFVGARHFQFEPGTFRLTRISAHAKALLEHLKIDRGIGDTFDAHEIDAIVDWYVALLEAAVTEKHEPLDSSIGRLHVQVPPRWPHAFAAPLAVTLSGGVGQLVYDLRADGEPMGTTQFGDLGAELAARLVACQWLSERMGSALPEGLGRATVYGLLRHATELSGTTLYLAHPQRLPLRNVPIVGRIGQGSSDDALAQALDLAARAAPAACLQVELQHDTVRRLGTRLAAALAAAKFPSDRTLVLMVAANLGKVLGSYASRWGTLPVDLIVIDEVPSRDAQFVRLGKPCEGTVPVALFGMR